MAWYDRYRASQGHPRREDSERAYRRPVKDQTRVERHAAMVALVADRGGWLTSSPGALDATMDCLPGSTLPTELANAGYEVEEIGEGQRILPHAITESVVIDDGAPPITVTHSGIVRVLRYSFPLP
ncbi:hypothetical protein NLM31_21070 [Bradyrhizobium sp. CCGUVB4N]|uniref:hypothetical protein n=1 Tax=Bradyrhizobium sp. CCGUVB4N TaxID=2949631 RepID=UPI0020B355C9|nr:hypothetical protein [Bradyrhizobium sp. CCGUVB4N]MCP3382862.1 hypothetical protein [Bradyrhizobium sp. CCGUVB4N]